MGSRLRFGELVGWECALLFEPESAFSAERADQNREKRLVGGMLVAVGSGVLPDGAQSADASSRSTRQAIRQLERGWAEAGKPFS